MLSFLYLRHVVFRLSDPFYSSSLKTGQTVESPEGIEWLSKVLESYVLVVSNYAMPQNFWGDNFMVWRVVLSTPPPVDLNPPLAQPSQVTPSQS